MIDLSWLSEFIEQTERIITVICGLIVIGQTCSQLLMMYPRHNAPDSQTEASAPAAVQVKETGNKQLFTQEFFENTDIEEMLSNDELANP